MPVVRQAHIRAFAHGSFAVERIRTLPRVLAIPAPHDSDDVGLRYAVLILSQAVFQPIAARQGCTGIFPQFA